MIQFISSLLVPFMACFSRAATFDMFVIVIAGLLTRTDILGAGSSIVRCESFSPRAYESIIKFFRSSAYNTFDPKDDESSSAHRISIQSKWCDIVNYNAELHRINGRTVLIGDGTKQPKEGRRMPGAKKLVQESGDSTKPEYIYGYLFGAVSILTGHEGNYFATPLICTIQDGLAEIAGWSKDLEDKARSHVVQMIILVCYAAKHFRPSYCILDRYFFTIPVLKKLNELNNNDNILDIITRAKKNCKAFEKPDPNEENRRGPKRKKGEQVKLINLFEKESDHFTRASATLYGKNETVEYLCVNLLWGICWYQEVRFVLVKSESMGNCILVSTDLTLDPVSIIEAYSLRVKIETAFRTFKQDFGGFDFRFWTEAVEETSPFKKASEPGSLASVEDDHSKELVIKSVDAIERYVLFSNIAMGITQIIALNPKLAAKANAARYMRTKSEEHVSEATILDYLRKHFFISLLCAPTCTITKIILKAQKRYLNEDEQENAS